MAKWLYLACGYKETTMNRQWSTYQVAGLSSLGALPYHMTFHANVEQTFSDHLLERIVQVI